MAIARAERAGGLPEVQVAILAKAPVAGLAKTRLIPALGPRGAARLQRQFTRAALHTAGAAGLGAVTLWCAPHAQHRFFRALRRSTGLDCRVQPEGDLGARMHAAFVAHCAHGPLLLTGTDCPPLRPAHLRQAAQALLDGADAVFHPAEDGGYVLVGLRRPQAALFEGMAWSTPEVMAQTRARAAALGLRVRELETLWDVDVPADLARWRAGVAVGASATATATATASTGTGTGTGAVAA
jgi:rSAM/selenodomain-associated transferase 1